MVNIRHRLMLFFHNSSLSDAVDSKKDLFIIFRFLASFLVLYAHSYHIYGLGADPFTQRTGVYTGTFAVYIFFTISGFFIIKSAMDRSFPQYILARFIRIYPALILCNFTTIVFIIPIAMDLNWISFVFTIEAKEYLKINSILDTLKFTIAGVFENNPDKAINGSLWTLPVEVRAYVVALLIVMLGLTKRKSVFNSFLFITVFVNFKFPDFYSVIFPVPGSVSLLFYFLLGCFLYVNRKFIPVSPILVVITSILVVKYRFEWPSIVISMLLSYLVISSGYVLRRYLDFNLKNDYSYGFYLYAYPVSQLSYIFFSELGFYYYLLFVVFLTMVLSFLSWHLVEKTVSSFARSAIFPKMNCYTFNVSN
ncbi:acyltransferase [Enterovibrio norvegicus FF-33]|nr:acyltransferase [Enterovibrio norvegicus FF-33]